MTLRLYSTAPAKQTTPPVSEYTDVYFTLVAAPTRGELCAKRRGALWFPGDMSRHMQPAARAAVRACVWLFCVYLGCLPNVGVALLGGCAVDTCSVCVGSHVFNLTAAQASLTSSNRELGFKAFNISSVSTIAICAS